MTSSCYYTFAGQLVDVPSWTYDLEGCTFVLYKDDYEFECEYELLQLAWYKSATGAGTGKGKHQHQEETPQATGGVSKGRTGGRDCG